MSNANTPLSQYQQLLHQFQSQKAKVEKLIFIISTLRLISFISLVLLAYWAYKSQSALLWSIDSLILVAFLTLMKWHSRRFAESDFLVRLIRINQEEIQALQGNFEAFDGGAAYEISDHDFSLDLDVFGKNSLYQMLNRTASMFGGKQLASWLNFPLGQASAIEDRQQAVAELAKLISLRQNFRANALSIKNENVELIYTLDWMNQPHLFFGKLRFKWLIIIAPILNLSLIGLALLHQMPYKYLMLWLLLNLTFIGFFLKKINRIHQQVGKHNQYLDQYVSLFQLIEKQAFHSKVLQQIQQQLEIGKTKVSEELAKLKSIMTALDTRLNVFVGIVLNAIFLWDILQIYRLEAWKQKHATQIPKCFDALGQMEALMSIANLHYNQVHWTFPKLSAVAQWEFKSVRHPLMSSEECVANDFIITAMPHFTVITGANMAGKSTFLRSIGTNLILAMIGGPVHAQAMIFYPTQLMSSLRTTDSLSKHESYFYAEIKRLQKIVTRLRAGEEVFILLDEILKGTNSKDKEQGSKALLQQLVKLKTVGIIATHDLSLGKLEDEFSEIITNQCFEVDIINDQLAFDYTIRTGVAQNMNASFLLAKMGITS